MIPVIENLDWSQEHGTQTLGASKWTIIVTSTKTSEGLENLRQILADQNSVLVGPDGAGKTNLLNALEPDLDMRAKTVNQSTGKGRHTTGHLEMFPLQCGGALIDTLVFVSLASMGLNQRMSPRSSPK
jgi:ribosome biogenesis GTPase